MIEYLTPEFIFILFNLALLVSLLNQTNYGQRHDIYRCDLWPYVHCM